jgi:hypothetical protein
LDGWLGLRLRIALCCALLCAYGLSVPVGFFFKRP